MAENTRRIAALIAAEIGARPEQAQAAIALIDEGSTVPFIARYRKEATGGLDDGQLRTLAERLVYLRELESRRAAILDFDPRAGQAHRAARSADSRKPPPRRSSRTSISPISRSAAPRPTSPASAAFSRSPTRSSPTATTPPADLAAAYVTGEVADAKAALEGARDILSESFAVNADLVRRLRAYMRDKAVLRAKVEDGKQEAGAKFSDYFDHAERWANVPSHRALAMLRGRNEGFLTLDLEVDADAGAARNPSSA